MFPSLPTLPTDQKEEKIPPEILWSNEKPAHLERAQNPVGIEDAPGGLTRDNTVLRDHGEAASDISPVASLPLLIRSPRRRSRLGLRSRN